MTDVTRAEDPLDLSLSEAELEAYREHIVEFVEDQRSAADAEIAVVALSGGIDSTLTGHLVVEALGAENVYGLVLPSEVNREGNMTDAERVASELLGVEYDVIAIDPIVEVIREATDTADDAPEMAVGNLRARIRAVLAYYAANRRDGLVVGTGNRSEAMVGYFTKYGDGAVDCHPIAPLYKAQVRQLAAHLGVPDDLVTKTPSAGLWVGQTDEEELGLDYDTLDSILALHVDGPLSPAATARTIGVDPEVVGRVRRMSKASAHKRQAPPGADPLF